MPWAYDNERPEHEVHLAPFRIGARPVSNGEYAAFVAAGGYGDDRVWSERRSRLARRGRARTPAGLATGG